MTLTCDGCEAQVHPVADTWDDGSVAAYWGYGTDRLDWQCPVEGSHVVNIFRGES